MPLDKPGHDIFPPFSHVGRALAPNQRLSPAAEARCLSSPAAARASPRSPTLSRLPTWRLSRRSCALSLEFEPCEMAEPRTPLQARTAPQDAPPTPGDDENEVFFGPVTDRERKARARLGDRRHTMLPAELLQRTGKENANAKKQLVVEEDDDDDEYMNEEELQREEEAERARVAEEERLHREEEEALHRQEEEERLAAEEAERLRIAEEERLAAEEAERLRIAEEERLAAEEAERLRIAEEERLAAEEAERARIAEEERLAAEEAERLRIAEEERLAAEEAERARIAEEERLAAEEAERARIAEEERLAAEEAERLRQEQLHRERVESELRTVANYEDSRRKTEFLTTMAANKAFHTALEYPSVPTTDRDLHFNTVSDDDQQLVSPSALRTSIFSTIRAKDAAHAPLTSAIPQQANEEQVQARMRAFIDKQRTGLMPAQSTFNIAFVPDKENAGQTSGTTQDLVRHLSCIVVVVGAGA